MSTLKNKNKRKNKTSTPSSPSSSVPETRSNRKKNPPGFIARITNALTGNEAEFPEDVDEESMEGTDVALKESEKREREQELLDEDEKLDLRWNALKGKSDENDPTITMSQREEIKADEALVAEWAKEVGAPRNMEFKDQFVLAKKWDWERQTRSAESKSGTNTKRGHSADNSPEGTDEEDPNSPLENKGSTARFHSFPNKGVDSTVPLIDNASTLERMIHIQHLRFAKIDSTPELKQFYDAQREYLARRPKPMEINARASAIPNNTLITTTVACKVNNNSVDERKRTKFEDNVVLESDLLMSVFDPNGFDTIQFVVPDHEAICKLEDTDPDKLSGDTRFQFEGVALQSTNDNNKTSPIRMLPAGIMGLCAIKNISTTLVKSCDPVSVIMNTTLTVWDEAGKRKPAAFIKSPQFMIPDLLCLTPAQPGGPILALVLP